MKYSTSIASSQKPNSSLWKRLGRKQAYHVFFLPISLRYLTGKVFCSKSLHQNPATTNITPTDHYECDINEHIIFKLSNGLSLRPNNKNNNNKNSLHLGSKPQINSKHKKKIKHSQLFIPLTVWYLIRGWKYPLLVKSTILCKINEINGNFLHL